MRIEITSAQAGRPTRTPRVPALSAKPFAKPSAKPFANPFATGPRTAKPFTARPLAAQPLAAAAFSPAAGTPVPVRWDAVRGERL